VHNKAAPADAPKARAAERQRYVRLGFRAEGLVSGMNCPLSAWTGLQTASDGCLLMVCCR